MALGRYPKHKTKGPHYVWDSDRRSSLMYSQLKCLTAPFLRLRFEGPRVQGTRCILRSLPAGLIILLTSAWTIAGLAENTTPPPRARRGALPFPGLFTLFTLADPHNLGIAQYEASSRLVKKRVERSRGILYTERAGFLDLAHIRVTMDWSRYVTGRVAVALRRREAFLELPPHDHCRLRLSFRYPHDWETIVPTQQELVITELALRIGQQVTISIMTWHEIISWFGYGTTLFWSEKPSAFTYDDIMSHVVGINAADAALRNPTRSWSVDATYSLDHQLTNLGVVPKQEAARAVDLVEGLWWSEGYCIRRMLDIGEQDDHIRPWLVRGMPGGSLAPPAFSLPTLRDIHGRDFSDFYTLTIKPSRRIPPRISEICRNDPELVNPTEHFALLMETIRYEVKRELGPTADQPY